MAEQRSPGWYDDGQGQTRWWSGRGWTTHIKAAQAIAEPAAQAPDSDVTEPIARRARRAGRLTPAGLIRTRLARAVPSRAALPTVERTTPPRGFRGRTLLITAGAAAVLGIIMGAGTGGGGTAPSIDPTKGPEYVALQTRLTSAVSERDALQVRADDATDKVAAMTDKQSTLDAASDDLDARATALDKREAKLDKRAKRLTKAASKVTSTPKEVVQKAPVSVYYQNCDAARAAGAAPVHRGDAGYASHLDRDGDGVGCE